MNQVDLETLTPEEMREQGFERLGPSHWQKKHGPGKVENYYGEPKGPNYRNGSTGQVNRVILTDRCWREILRQLDRHWDGRETAIPILGVCGGREVFLLETVEATYLGDARYEHQMRLKDEPAYRAEEYRQANGHQVWYLSQLHTHPVGNPPLPSSSDEFAFSCRTRREAGDIFVGLIISPEEGGIFRQENLRAYVCQKVNGTHKTVPVTLEVGG